MINQSAAPAKIHRSTHTTKSPIHWLTLSKAKQSIASMGTKKTSGASPIAEPVTRTGGGASNNKTNPSDKPHEHKRQRKEGESAKRVGVQQGWAFCAYPRE